MKHGRSAGDAEEPVAGALGAASATAEAAARRMPARVLRDGRRLLLGGR
jgi:hypothetical protein